jgi:cyclophilin family peptidyl-prolyl cis-trans isomerase
MAVHTLGKACGCIVAVSTALALTAGLAGQTKPRAGARPAAKPAAAKTSQPSPGAGPIIVVETAKGTFEFETYPEDSPKSVEHILALVKRNFYNGQRVHRVEKGVVVQWGDSRTRDMTKQDLWGRSGGGGSGRPIGVTEFSKKRLHIRGAVGLAHANDATQADSQIYVILRKAPSLDGKHVVIGKVISGLDVVEKLQVTDIIKRMSVRPTT